MADRAARERSLSRGEADGVARRLHMAPAAVRQIKAVARTSPLADAQPGTTAHRFDAEPAKFCVEFVVLNRQVMG